MTADFEEIALRIVSAGFYGQVLASFQELSKKHPNGVVMEAIGLHAWEQIDDEQRAKSLPYILGAYASRVFDEENQERIASDAADPSESYLEPHDTAVLWDALTYTQALGRDVEIEVSSASLANVLSELDLLRHRLTMRDQGGGGRD